MMQIVHPIAPLFDENATVLVLGTFPSVKSREGMFFYHHPQNRFWKVLAAVFEQPVPVVIAEKTAFLHANRIALWDVIAQCEIEGSSDASIRSVVPNDLRPILQAAPIRRIFCNGTTAWNLYQTYQLPQTGIPAVKLPSTSPANARSRLPDLVECWSVLREA